MAHTIDEKNVKKSLMTLKSKGQSGVVVDRE